MRLAAPFFSAPRAPLAATFLATLKAKFGAPKAPSAPARPMNASLPQRVRVALQAAARARR